MSEQTDFSFYWSLDGRKLTTITEATLRRAKAEFKRRFPRHARYMGEIHITFPTRSYYAVYRSADPSRTMLGGVVKSRSALFSHKEDAQARLDATIGIHAGLPFPLVVIGEVRESWRYPEIFRHCPNSSPQDIGSCCSVCCERVRRS